MKQTISTNDFVEAFRKYDRFDQFGRAALESLFDYLEETEDSLGEEMELDVIALCCDYAASDVDTIAQDYNIDVDGMDDDEKRAAVLEYLNENTTVVDDDCDGMILYCSAF